MPIPREIKHRFNRTILTKRSISHENQLQILLRDIFGSDYADHLYHFDSNYPPPPRIHGELSLLERIKRLEEGMSLLLDHFNLEVKNQPPKKLVEKHKRKKS